MAHAQKPDFVFRAKRTSPFKSAGGWRQFSRLLVAEVCVISGSNAGYTMFRGSVKGTGYPLHSPVSPSLRHPVRHRVPSHFNRSLTTVATVHSGNNTEQISLYTLYITEAFGPAFTHCSKQVPLQTGRGQLKCNGTCTETRFRLSAKRTSAFKSARGHQFSRLLAAEVCASAVVMLDTACSEVV